MQEGFERLHLKLEIKDDKKYHYTYKTREYNTAKPEWVLRLTQKHKTYAGSVGERAYHARLYNPKNPLVLEALKDVIHASPSDAPPKQVIVDVMWERENSVTTVTIMNILMLWHIDRLLCEIDKVCSLCLELKEDHGAPAWDWVELPCNHRFHAHCLVKVDANSCPLCREDYDPNSDVARCLVSDYDQALLQAEANQAGGRSRTKARGVRR